MLDPYKIRTMAKAEMIRQEDLKKFGGDPMISRNSYIMRGMTKSFIGVTLTFLIALILWVYIQGVNMDVLFTAERVIRGAFVYGVVLVIYLIISYFVYRKKYLNSEARQNEYIECLQRLKNMR